MPLHRRPTTRLLAALMLLSPAGAAGAQATDSSYSLVGATRVAFNAGAALAPGPSHSLFVSGSFLSFVDEHLQLGLAPAISGYTSQGSSSIGGSLVGTANLVVGSGRLRGYAGGNAGGGGATHGSGTGVFGVQAGALYFVGPATALRAELAARRSTRDDATTSSFIVTIDPYLLASPTGPVSLPSRGAADLSGTASATFDGGLLRGIDLMVAPFLSRSAQVGLHLDAVSYFFAGGRQSSHTIDGFARLYAPAGPGAVPFVQGFAAGRPSGSGGDGALESYGLVGGVRHYFNQGVALDVAARWQRFAEDRYTITDPFTGGTITFTNRLPNQLTLEAKFVTQLRR